jgi:hypothetical protein
MKFPTNPEMKAFISPRIGKIQEAIVFKLSEENPKIKSFRDVPPELRDQFAQAIISSTMESFFSSIEPQSSQTNEPPENSMNSQQPQMLPQDEPQTPAASRG